MTLGTPAYMAPEQGAADPAMDHRVDLYSFGVMGYEILTGQTPFTGRSPQAMLGAHIVALPDPVASRRPGMPPLLANLIMRCLEKRPSDRPQTAGEIMNALDMLSTPSGGTVPITAVRSPQSGALGTEAAAPTWRRLGLLAAALVVAGGAALWARPRWAEPPAAPAEPETAIATPTPAPAPAPAAAPPEALPAPPSTAFATGRAAAPPARPSVRIDLIGPGGLRAGGPAPGAGGGRPHARRRRGRRRHGDRAGRLERRAGRVAGRPGTRRGGGGAALQRHDALVERRGGGAATAGALPVARAPGAAARPPRPAPARDTTPLPAPDPAMQIRVLFEEYGAGIEARSVEAIRRTYPGLSPEQAREWEEFFKGVTDIRVDLNVAGLKVNGDAAEARLAGVYVFDNPSTHRTQREPRGLPGVAAAGGQPVAHHVAALIRPQKVYSDPTVQSTSGRIPPRFSGNAPFATKVTARGMVSLSPSDALMMSSRRSGMEEVRMVRRNGSSSTTSPGTGISLDPTGNSEIRSAARVAHGREELVEAGGQEKDVGLELPPAVLVADVGVGREVAQPGRDDAEPAKRHRARSPQVLLAAGGEAALRRAAPARPARPPAGSP